MPGQPALHDRLDCCPSSQVSRLQQNLGQDDDWGATPLAQQAASPDWTEVPDLDVRSAFLSKPIKAASLPGGRVLMFYKACRVSSVEWKDVGVYAHKETSPRPRIPLNLLHLLFQCIQVGETFFCSAANSTAFKYPLADASIIQVQPDGSACGGEGWLLSRHYPSVTWLCLPPLLDPARS